KAFQRKGIPIVFFNRICEEMIVPKVVINDYDAAVNVVQHLIQTGKKRIVHLAGPLSLATSRKRMNGYIDALKLSKIEVDESLIIPYERTRDKVEESIEQIMKMEN